MSEAFPSPTPTPRCPHCQAQVDVVHQPGCPDAPTPNIYGRLRELESVATDRDRAPDAIREMLDQLSAFFVEEGAAPSPDVERTLRELVQEHPRLIVRRENPRALLQALAANQPLPIRFDPGAHSGEPYPNAALLDSGLEGLRIPYQRGFSTIETGALVFVIGFTPSEEMRVQPIPKDAYAHYAGADRSRVRMVDGVVSRDDLRFVLVRFPRRMFPEDRMTDMELEREQVAHISRLFTFGQAEAERLADAA